MRVDAELTESLDSAKEPIGPFSQPGDEIRDDLPAAEYLDCASPAFDVGVPAQSRLHRRNKSKRVEVARLDMDTDSVRACLAKLDQRFDCAQAYIWTCMGRSTAALIARVQAAR